MTGRVPPLNLALVSQAYEKYDLNSPPLSPIQTPRNALPKQTVFAEEIQDSKVDEFDAFQAIDIAFEKLSVPVIDAELYEHLGSYINGYKIVADFKEQLFLTHMRVKPPSVSSENEESKKSKEKKPINYKELDALCSDNIQTIFRICTRFIERYNNIEFPKYERKKNKKEFRQEFKSALTGKNKAILKCIQDLCIAVTVYYKVVDDRYFYTELSNRFCTVACLEEDSRSVWARLAVSLPLIPDETSGDLMFPSPEFSITGCLSKGVADIVKKANEIEKDGS